MTGSLFVDSCKRRTAERRKIVSSQKELEKLAASYNKIASLLEQPKMDVSSANAEALPWSPLAGMSFMIIYDEYDLLFNSAKSKMIVFGCCGQRLMTHANDTLPLKCHNPPLLCVIKISN